MCELVLELWLHKWLCKLCGVSLRSLQVLQTPRLMRSRVIYCQNWYSRTANVHWCRNKRATAGVVGISQMRWAQARSQESEGPWRQRLGFDLSDGLAGRLDCRTADTKDGFATPAMGQHQTQPKQHRGAAHAWQDDLRSRRIG